MKNERIALEGREALLPELRLVAFARLRRARAPGLPAHRHRRAYEIFFIIQGEVEWWTEEETWKGRAGHLFVNKPGEVHGSVGPALKPCSYYWFQLAFPRGKPLPGLGRRQSARLEEALRRLEPRLRRGTPELGRLFAALFEECRRPGAERVLVARAILHQLLGRLVRLSRERAPGGEISAPVRRCLRWLEAQPVRAVTVAEWAAVARWSVSHFRERFFRETGFSPVDYLCRRRVGESKTLLRAGESSVTAIAHRLGFGSSQYFATVFKKMEGVTPTEFRRRAEAVSPRHS